MNKRLYIGNLSYDTTAEELEQAFSEVGTVVSANIITDRETGRSKGFGFVEMDTEAEAQAAIERFNEQSIGGRNLRVAEARPRNDDRGGGGFGGDRRGGGDRGGGGGRRRF